MRTIEELLDERGVSYEHPAYPEDPRDLIVFFDEGGNRFTYYTNRAIGWSKLYGYHITPEMVIAATLGVGTCHLVDNDHGPNMHCDACGGEVDDEYLFFMERYGYSRCPHCGRHIEQEDEQP